MRKEEQEVFEDDDSPEIDELEGPVFEGARLTAAAQSGGLRKTACGARRLDAVRASHRALGGSGRVSIRHAFTT